MTKLYIPECIAALVLHELAHVVMAKALGVRVKRCGISWSGPYIVREPGPPFSNAAIALAGPLLNVLLGLVSVVAAPTFGLINIVLGVSNLIPTVNSDGRRVINALRVAGRQNT